MIKLVVFLLLLSVQSFGQSFIFPAVISTPGSTPIDTPAGARTLIYEPFDGTSLDSRWSLRRPEKMTYSVDGGYFKVTGNADTVPPVVGYSFYRAKSFQLRLSDTAYGQSMMREFTVEFGGIVKKVNDTTFGAFAGAQSVWNNYYTDNYVCYDYADPAHDTLISIGIDDTIYHHPPQGFTANPLSNPVEVNDYIIQRLSFRGDTSWAFIKNVTKGDSATVALKYRYDIIVYPLRPLTFYYAFGVMGRTEMWFDYLHVTTTELQHPAIMLIGDSKPSGYLGGDADSNFCYMLRPYTTSSVQLWAGPGATVTSTFDCLKEFRNNTPTQAIILDLGTNSGGTFADYIRLNDSLTAIASVPIYQILTPNGGNPATPGTWNYQIANQYPTTYIDTWTTGWNTMTIGNGEMVDTVHPSATGQRKIALIIKAALPALFPL